MDLTFNINKQEERKKEKGRERQKQKELTLSTWLTAQIDTHKEVDKQNWTLTLNTS